MFKKTSLALLGLAASSYVSAGTMGPVCTPGNVTVPCEARAWDLGIQALYLKSVYDADRAYRQVQILPDRYEDVHGWDWGYRLEGSYHFNTGNDVTINWTHYSDYVSPNGLIGSVAVFPINFPYSVTGIYKNRFDQVNLVVGQHADFGLVKNIRFYGGLQYAKIDVDDTNYYATIFPVLGPVQLFDNTDFNGLGPVWGIDYSYDLTSAFSVTANGAASILYGTGRYNLGYAAFPAGPNGAIVNSIYASKKMIVPSLEAKLGLNYAYNMPQGVLNIEGGYQVMNYFNALHSQFLQTITTSLANSDYGLYGPYIGVKYLGNA
ncbi:membrane protein [Legionella norrlandica]|uniref:Membrane protein n=1 Tax=Legionella norrlandica TaxID=1498499 RepID=A0A0A2SNM3_9GAMM|nr:Lpg1974 family pore-forming outer membrane protein [Legionella norrlandica]KGP62332.1 membrane protein [Legionella norrlandica]